MQFDQLKRREFISLLGGAAAWPLAARGLSLASECGGWRGWRNSAGIDGQGQLHAAAFRDGLEKAGWLFQRHTNLTGSGSKWKPSPRLTKWPRPGHGR